MSSNLPLKKICVPWFKSQFHFIMKSQFHIIKVHSYIECTFCYSCAMSAYTECGLYGLLSSLHVSQRDMVVKI